MTHTFSILYPSTQPSQRNGKDRCCNQCEVCGNKRQQLTEKLCQVAVYMSRCGMTQICSYFSHAHVFVVLSVLLSHSVCGSTWRQTGDYLQHFISTLSPVLNLKCLTVNHHNRIIKVNISTTVFKWICISTITLLGFVYLNL